MARQPINWRHWMAAALLLALIATLTWRLAAPRPTAEAPAGAQPRLHDAPEGPVAPVPR